MTQPLEPKSFMLLRGHGSGRILDGVVFHTGQVVVCWRSDLQECRRCGHPSEDHHYGSGPDYPHDGLSDHVYEPAHNFASLGVYPTFDAFKEAHLDRNPGSQARVVWRDEPLSKEQAKDVYSEGIQMGLQMGRQLSDQDPPR